MSLETALTEEPLPNGALAAQHISAKPQQNSQCTTFMAIVSTDNCETPASEWREEVGIDIQHRDKVSQPDRRPESEQEPEPEADAQILEALRSGKDRLFVLKLGESMESLIQERHLRSRVELTPASTYHKLLVHRCAAYYKLTPETEAGSKSIALVVASESRIPTRRVADLVPPDDSPHPAFKIMRRTPLERTRSKASSQVGSGNDDNAAGDTSDGDPSENGSSRGSRRKQLTMSERQAQYDEARSRIFKDLEEKEKKAQDMSASSSTLSLLSVGSSSGGVGGGGASSVGESLDETSNLDRDWVPGKDKADSGRRAGSATSANRRSTAPTFNGRGHSPGFNYPTLYEPAPTASTSSLSSYDSSPSSGSSAQTPPYQPTLYPVYQYGVPTFLAPFPYSYYHYGHPPPPAAPPHHPSSQRPPEPAAASVNGSSGSSPADSYPPMAFVNPYMWPPPPPPSHIHHQPPQQPSQQQQTHPQQPDCQMSNPQQAQEGPRPTEYPHPPLQYPHIPIHAYPYPPPGSGYLQPLPPQMQYPHHGGRPQSQGPIPDAHRLSNPPTNHVHGTASQPQLFHPGPFETRQGPAVSLGSPARNGVAGSASHKGMQARSGWSHGTSAGGSSIAIAGETVGPRMSVARRTNSGNNAMSSYSGSNRALGDETASTASSSTSSSSSRQTFTSNSSKHPLPARPDWAVGLKPQPTLHHSSSHHSSPRSHHGHLPSQSHSHNHSQQRPQPQTPLYSNDFPPLPVSPPSVDKRPVLGGVWAGSTTTRGILGPSLGRSNNAAGLSGGGRENVNHSFLSDGQIQQNPRLDEHDHAFERPGPKPDGELFNPNGVGIGGGGGARLGTKSPPNGAARKVHPSPEKDRTDKDKANARGETVANAILIDRVAAMRIAPSNGEELGALNLAVPVGEGTAT